MRAPPALRGFTEHQLDTSKNLAESGSVSIPLKTTVRPRSVESTTGAVAVGSEELRLSGGFRRESQQGSLPAAILKSNVRIFRIRLFPVQLIFRFRQVEAWTGIW